MEKIDGRTAFVTGGASGIGLAIAQALVDEGARVMIADIDGPALDAAVAALGSDAAGVRLDVRDRAEWAAAKIALESRFGPVDILVNNAGIGPDGHTLADMDPVAFDRVIAIKLTGTFNGIATFAAGMRERGDGHIVNTASMAGLIASAKLGAYTASKFAVVGLSEVLRAEMARHGVGVSVLCPGLIRTNLGATTIAAGSDRVTPRTPSTDQGIDPAIVGALVVDGIRANAMHIVTHGDYQAHVAERMARVVAAFDGVPVRAGGTPPGTDTARD
ncbi:SDR family oxidoreductase [Sphingomonas immobilis]|uniref:SDR family oxidoreductase n=1 Tax=Sphingomonas immobilis TaxID=3063997 RepID=A0ABT8ZXC2_9SPHN|nr:SDR family oxidoreductase [Sphingomonas sp. CA1-15]MDO7842220.1 SDR family oxidoreductase [Sphingomonas sp. CA1-15]